MLALAWLAGCARPLTEAEARFAQDLFGGGLDTAQVRVARGFGLAPPPRPEPGPLVVEKLHPRPGICDRTEPGLEPGPPPAFTLYNTVHLMAPFYRADTAPGWPDRVMIPQALILGHELVHVWQWQNRARTGYRPVLAALESLLNADPYFYTPADGGFLRYGFEQQGALVEDYLCHALFDPTAPRRAELRAILAPVFPVGRIDAALAH